MPIPWLVVLTSVPWTEVINNAPRVADGARKLWNAISKKSPKPEVDTPTINPTLSAEAQTLALLQTQLTVVESATTELHNQLLASSELIKALAEQNTQLIQRIETNRVRVIWLGAAVALIGIVALTSLAFSLSN